MSIFTVKSINELKEEKDAQVEELRNFKPPFLLNLLAHIIFWVIMITVGVIIGLIWAMISENKRG